MEKIILTTGGTGGHIFPALAVAEALRRRHPAIELFFIGSLYGQEKTLAARAGIPFVGLPVRGFLGRGVRAFGAALRMCGAIGSAVSLIRKFRPQAVIGFGSYAAFAPLFAARMLGIPSMLHEQNAVAGTSNRIMGRFARKICVSLEGTQGFPEGKCVVTGNPVRESVIARGRNSRNKGTRRLLVLGGSQGAHAVNAFVVGQLPYLKAAGVEILHQTGERDEGNVRAAYVSAGFSPSCVRGFIDDMAAAYSWADVALCRAGASSVAELCVAGLPAVLVPFPYAIHDHQTKNALVMEKAGAARLVPERDLDKASPMLEEMLSDGGRREAMAAAALAAARPDAADRVVLCIEDMLAHVE